MYSQKAQRSTSPEKGTCICPPLHLYSGHHQKKPCENGAHHPSFQDTGNRSHDMVSNVMYEVRNPTPSSLPFPLSKPLETPSSAILTHKRMPSLSQSLNASVSIRTASRTSSIPVKDRSINSLHSHSPASQQQRQHPLPTFREAERSLPSRKTSDTCLLRRPQRMPHDVEDAMNAPLPHCYTALQARKQALPVETTDSENISVPVPTSEAALMSILPVDATLTADATDGRVPAENPSFSTLRMPHQKQTGPQALHNRNDMGRSSTKCVARQQKAQSPSITALRPEMVTSHVTQAYAATRRGTAFEPHPPLTPVPFSSRHPTVVEVLRRQKPAPSTHASASHSGALDDLGHFTLPGTLSKTSPIPAEDSGASEGNHVLGTLNPHPPAGLRPLAVEEVSGGCDSGLGLLSSCPPSQPHSSLSCIISTTDTTEGKSRIGSCVRVSDTDHFPQTDNERLSIPSSTCCLNASRNMIEILPFIDPFAGCVRMPSARVRASTTRSRSRHTRSGIADLLTSFGTPAGTTSSSDSVLEHCAAGPQSRRRTRKRSSTLKPFPTHGNGCASTAPTHVADTSHTLDTATPPLVSLTSTTEEKEHEALEQPPSCGSKNTCNAPALTTPCLPRHSTANTLAMEAPMNDCDVAQSGSAAVVAVCTQSKLIEDQQRKQLCGSSTLQNRTYSEVGGILESVESLAAATDTVASTLSATTPSFTCTASPQDTATPTRLGSCTSLSVSVMTLEESVLAVAPEVVPVAVVTMFSPLSRTTPTSEEPINTAANHQSSPLSPERHQVNSFLRSASALSIRSSSLGRSSQGTTAASGYNSHGGRGHHGPKPLSFVRVPPLVCSAQALSLCSLTASGVHGWEEEGTVDAPLDVCATTMSSLLRKTDSQLRTEDSSVFGGSNLLWMMPRSECAAGVGGILRSRNSFCASHLGLSSRAKRPCSSSLKRTPPPPGPQVTATNFPSNVSFQRTIFVNPSARSLVGVIESDAASLAATTTITTTAGNSIAHSKAHALLPLVGQSSVYQDEEAEGRRDMMIGFAVAQDTTIATQKGHEEIQPSRIRAMGAMLEHPDAPPFAKAAIKRLHVGCFHQLRQTQSPHTDSPPGLLDSGRDDAAAEVPVIVTTTASIHSCLCMRHSCMTKPQTSSASAAAAEDLHCSAQFSETPSHEQARIEQSSASLVPHLCHECCQLGDVHEYSKEQQRTATILLESVKAIQSPRWDPLGSRDVVDASRPTVSCLRATEVHLPKVLPVKRRKTQFSVKRLLGL